jgi:hypothetical protein
VCGREPAFVAAFPTPPLGSVALTACSVETCHHRVVLVGRTRHCWPSCDGVASVSRRIIPTAAVRNGMVVVAVADSLRQCRVVVGFPTPALHL